MCEALLPMSALLRRELLRHLRRKRVIAAVVLLGLSMVWLVYRDWPTNSISRASLINVSGNLAMYLSLSYAIAAMLVLPGYAAMCVRSEHDSDTYELMSLTLLTPHSILVATLINVVGLFIFAVAATLPVYFLSYVLLPHSWWIAFAWLWGSVITATMCAAAGVYAGAKSKRTADAMGRSYGIAVAATVASLATPSIIANTVGLFTLAWIISLAIPIGITVLLVAQSVRWLKKTSFERVRDEPAETKLTIRERWLQHVSQRPRSVYPDGRNPVFVREFGDALHRAQINRGSLLATVVLSLVLFAWTLVMVQGGEFSRGVWGVESPPQTLQWYFVTTMLIAACTIPGISTPAWTNDRNSDMEEALDLTLLTRRERFIGRACAAAALPFIVTACWGFGFGPVLVNATKSASAAAVALIGGVALAATLFNLLALGRRIARTPLSTPAAVVLVHLIAIAYIGLPYMAIPRFGDAATLTQLGITAISPIAAVLCAVHYVRFQPVTGLYAYLGAFTAIQFLFLVILAWGDVRPEWKTRKVIQ